MSILGRGWSFPPRLNDRGHIGVVADEEDIRQAIRIIIGTVPGERVMRPDFGCRIHDLIFWPANFETAILAERYVTEALERWEPRITLTDVTADPGSNGDGQLVIQINYTIKPFHDPRSLVHPFFLLPTQKG